MQQARIEAIKRIGAIAKDEKVQFIVVAGDLFDSPSADKATVSSACSAIGQAGLPVIAIPGNHGTVGRWGHPRRARRHGDTSEAGPAADAGY